MKKLFYTLALLICGISAAMGQTYTDVYSGHFTHTNVNGKEYDYTLVYSITYTDNNLSFEGSIDWNNGGSAPAGALPGMEAWINNVNMGSISLNSNTPLTVGPYNKGDIINFRFHLPVEAGEIWFPEEGSWEYSVGSVNENAKPQIDLTASVEDIEMNSANVKYTVTVPEGYPAATVTLTVNDKEYKGENGVIALTDLVAGTAYNCTLKAVADDLEKEIAVNFTTLRDTSKEIHNYQIINGFLPNAYLIGEDNTMRRNIPLTMKSDMTYNPDGTITVDFTVNCQNRIEGFIAEISISDGLSDGWSGDLQPISENQYRYTSPKSFEPTDKPVIFYWMKFAGGVERFNFKEISLLESNEPVDYLTPVTPVLTTIKTELVAGTPQAFCAYLMDENENFILTERPTLTLEDNTADATIEGDFITLNKQGEATLVASCNEKTEKITFKVAFALSDEAINLASGKIPEVSEYCTNPKEAYKATDGDIGTDVVFECGKTEEHTIKLDLGNEYEIEMIKLVWEGAAPKVYDVILSDAFGNKKKTDNVTDGEGGAGATIYKNFFYDNVEARYVTIQTYEAYNKGWGIKLKEMEVHGLPTWEVMAQDESIPMISSKTLYVTKALNIVQNNETSEWVYSALFKSPKGEKVYYSAQKEELTENRLSVRSKVSTAELQEADSKGNDYYMVDLPVASENGGKGTVQLYTVDDNGNLTSEEPYTMNYQITSGDNTETGVEVVVEAEGEAEYYTLQGVKVANPDKGIYIKVCGNKATKVIR